MKLSERPTPRTNDLLASKPSTFDTQSDAESMRGMVDLARSLERRLSAAVEALEMFEQCDLNESNCASLEVATRRIKNLARATLAEIKEGM